MNCERLLRRTGLDTDELRDAIDPVDPARVFLRRASPLVVRALGKDIGGVTLWNLILIRPDMFDGPLDRLASVAIHELVHVRQWRRLGLAGFGFAYSRAYLRGRLSGLSHRDAYRANRFEVEAREVQSRLS